MFSPCTRCRRVFLTLVILSEMEAESGSPESHRLRGRCQTRFLHSERRVLVDLSGVGKLGFPLNVPLTWCGEDAGSSTIHF
jgi:hypothetical protein